METLLEALKKGVIKEYKRYGDNVALLSPCIEKSSYTGNEIADEIEKESEFGNRIVTSLVQLAVMMVARQKEELPIVLDFWYESNACWGQVNTLEDLVEKAQLQLASGNSMYDINDFLDKSTQCDEAKNYGTRREHNGESLRAYLDRLGATEKFMKLFGESNN